jgi:hypothetical protein
MVGINKNKDRVEITKWTCWGVEHGDFKITRVLPKSTPDDNLITLDYYSSEYQNDIDIAIEMMHAVIANDDMGMRVFVRLLLESISRHNFSSETFTLEFTSQLHPNYKMIYMGGESRHTGGNIEINTAGSQTVVKIIAC